MSQKRFENFPKALPSKQRASIFTVVKGEVVTQRAKPLTIVKILAMTAGRERPKEYLMNLKLKQICVHLIGGDTDLSISNTKFDEIQEIFTNIPVNSTNSS